MPILHCCFTRFYKPVRMPTLLSPPYSGTRDIFAGGEHLGSVASAIDPNVPGWPGMEELCGEVSSLFQNWSLDPYALTHGVQAPMVGWQRARHLTQLHARIAALASRDLDFPTWTQSEAAMFDLPRKAHMPYSTTAELAAWHSWLRGEATSVDCVPRTRSHQIGSGFGTYGWPLDWRDCQLPAGRDTSRQWYYLERTVTHGYGPSSGSTSARRALVPYVEVMMENLGFEKRCGLPWRPSSASASTKGYVDVSPLVWGGSQVKTYWFRAMAEWEAKATDPLYAVPALEDSFVLVWSSGVHNSFVMIDSLGGAIRFEREVDADFPAEQHEMKEALSLVARAVVEYSARCRMDRLTNKETAAFMSLAGRADGDKDSLGSTELVSLIAPVTSWLLAPEEPGTFTVDRYMGDDYALSVPREDHVDHVKTVRYGGALKRY